LAVIVLADVEAIRVARRVAATLHPPRASVSVPDGLGPLLPIALTTSDHVVVRGWYVPSRNGAAVVLAHGHGGQRGQLAFEARALERRGYGILLFDFRGHGESDERAVTWGAAEQLDLEAAIDYLTRRPEVNARRIGALGFSMGAMTVAMVAARDPRLRAAVMEGAYTSVEEMISHDERHYRWWSERVAVATLRRSGVPIDSVRPVDVVCRISPRPVLIVNGAEDEDTPVAVAVRLYRAACPPKSIWIIPHAGHASYAIGADRLAAVIGDFFDRSLRG
jgi:dipeptidyl aminopeptidase/acylaminoacyl peptidase